MRGLDGGGPLGVPVSWPWQPENAPATPCERCGGPAEPARFKGRASLRSRWCHSCRGFMCEEEDQQHFAQRIANMPIEERLLRAKHAEIPAAPLSLFVRATGPEDRPALLAAHDWLGAKTRFLVLSGPPGCGKTVAAAYTLWHRPLSGLFVYAGKLSQRSWYQEHDWRDVERSHLLVIDDMGQEPADKAGHWSGRLDTLMTIRDASLLRTVLTTNLDAARFGERYGQRLMDRIRGSGVWHADPGLSAPEQTQGEIPF